MSTPLTPPPAVYTPQHVLVADFFGAVPPPPPYSPQQHSDSLPDYSAAHEPTTLARYMFLYGFLFPPFWIMGISILLSPLRATPEWEAGKTEEQSAAALQLVRQAEVRWAKRCLYAFTAFLLLLALVGVAIYLAKRR